ncbi:MAG: GAF domain-containing protein [Actinomycetes bacterium]
MTGSDESHDAAADQLDVHASEPTRLATSVPFTFPAVARLELDELLEQLIGRANEVLRIQGRLRGLLRATQSIATDLDVPSLLQRIVEESRVLIGARYAAVGVIGEDRTLTQFVHSGMDPAVVERIGHLPTGRGILGQLITDPRPLRLQTLSEHASSVGFPPGHPPMRSFLGVPVRIRDRVFGNLYLAEKFDGEQFTSEDEELALALAAAAAAAIDNAQLFETVTRREHWLQVSRSVTNTLHDIEGRDEALLLFARAVRSTSAADFAAVVAPDGNGQLTVVAADGANAASAVGRAVPPESPTTRAVRERGPVVLEDLHARDDLTGPIKDVGIGPLAVVPLSARDQVLGALAIGNMPGGRLFTSLDVQMAEDFATQAALVLMDAAAQEAAKELEMSEERARIARDLHDHAIQGIFSVGLGLNSLALRVGGDDGTRMVELVDQLDDAIKSIRRSIFALQGPSGPGRRVKLRSRLAQTVKRSETALGFPPSLHTEGPVDSAVPDAVAEDLLAVLGEALSNAARHAHASSVEVLVVASGEVTLVVHDNGRGIGTPTRASGLGNMRSRAASHGGRCEVTDAPGGGTTVRWTAPIGTPEPGSPDRPGRKPGSQPLPS